MPLNYHRQSNIDTVTDRQDAYAQWCLNLSAAIQRNDADAAAQIPRPSMFLEGIKESLSQTCPPEQLSEIEERNVNLFKCADALLADSAQDGILADFTQLTAQFLQTLPALQNHIFYEEGGYDHLTKLKNSRQMYKDLNVEMERLSRQGMTFSIALAIINDFDEIKSLGEEKASACITSAAGGMMKCMRPFDDAYYWGENEFILCLKQTSLPGGLRAFERLEEYLRDEATQYESNGQNKRFTMACCVSEPVDGDDLDTLLKNLRADTYSEKDKEGASAFSFREISPLQRFMET